MTDCNAPLGLRPTPQAAVVLPQLFPFFITIFFAFHFPGQGEAQGAHLFLSCPFPVPRSKAHTGMCAHTLRTGPPQSPRGQRRTGTGSEPHPPISTPGTWNKRPLKGGPGGEEVVSSGSFTGRVYDKRNFQNGTRTVSIKQQVFFLGELCSVLFLLKLSY